MPTVHELETALQKAKEQEQRNQADAERKIREAKVKEEISLTDGYMTTLQQYLTKQDVITTLSVGRVGQYGNPVFATLKYPETDVSIWDAEPRIERRSKAYSSESSYQIQFGGHGKRQTFPRLKDGSFNYEKIATALARFIRDAAASSAARNKGNANYEASNALKTQIESEVKMPRGAAIWGTRSDPAKVELKVEALYSPDETRQILAVITAIEEARD